MFQRPYRFPQGPDANQDTPSTHQDHMPDQLGPLPWQTHEEVHQENLAPIPYPDPQAPPAWRTPTSYSSRAAQRIRKLEEAEPKRQLIRDAKVLGKIRDITQAEMAKEIGVPRRTLEEWLQFRRMPKAPGTTLLTRWVDKHRGKISH